MAAKVHYGRANFNPRSARAKLPHAAAYDRAAAILGVRGIDVRFSASPSQRRLASNSRSTNALFCRLPSAYSAVDLTYVTTESDPMMQTPQSEGMIRTNIPFRLDGLHWSQFHLLVVIGLGITWILDGLEVTIVGSLGPALQSSETLHLSSADLGAVASFYVNGCGSRSPRLRLDHGSVWQTSGLILRKPPFGSAECSG
jgi:hypothetical protein